MKVLVVSAFFPYPPAWGSATRVYQLIRHLSVEHSVTLLTYARPEQRTYEKELLAICEEVRFVSPRELKGLRRRLEQVGALFSRTPFRAREWRTPAMQAEIDDCLATGNFDIVQVEGSPLMGQRFRTDATVVLDEHNVESTLLRRQQMRERTRARRLYQRVQARKQEKFEAAAWESVDTVVVTSDREGETVRSRAPHLRVAVVPNATDPEYFCPPDEPVSVDGDSIVFTGLMAYRPNLDGVRYFVDEVLPLIRAHRPTTYLIVVGHWRWEDVELLQDEGVVITGRVRDVRPYLARAACVVVPLRIGGGTRLKIVDALGMARPVVSTTIGCEGLMLQADEHLLVADGPEAFARAVCRVLDDPALGRRLGAAGRQVVLSRYTWSASVAQLDLLYRQIAGTRHRAR